ncbi:MAG TPA: hypothetical protein VK861_01855 [Bacteroidales bacterium]|nr:hypothetical protein [Bacteroidales bacterium]
MIRRMKEIEGHCESVAQAASKIERLSKVVTSERTIDYLNGQSMTSENTPLLIGSPYPLRGKMPNDSIKSKKRGKKKNKSPKRHPAKCQLLMMHVRSDEESDDSDDIHTPCQDEIPVMNGSEKTVADTHVPNESFCVYCGSEQTDADTHCPNAIFIGRFRAIERHENTDDQDTRSQDAPIMKNSHEDQLTDTHEQNRRLGNTEDQDTRSQVMPMKISSYEDRLIDTHKQRSKWHGNTEDQDTHWPGVTQEVYTEYIKAHMKAKEARARNQAKMANGGINNLQGTAEVRDCQMEDQHEKRLPTITNPKVREWRKNYCAMLMNGKLHCNGLEDNEGQQFERERLSRGATLRTPYTNGTCSEPRHRKSRNYMPYPMPPARKSWWKHCDRQDVDYGQLKEPER